METLEKPAVLLSGVRAAKIWPTLDHDTKKKIGKRYQEQFDRTAQILRFKVKNLTLYSGELKWLSEMFDKFYIDWSKDPVENKNQLDLFNQEN